jgi:hypothetical protein
MREQSAPNTTKPMAVAKTKNNVKMGAVNAGMPW